MKQKIIFWLYCLLILNIIILADLNLLPLHLIRPIPHYDWAAHFLLYGLFYWLLSRMLMGKRTVLFRRPVEWAWLITLSLITTEEISQLFFPSRTFSLMDLFMGVLGMYLFRGIFIVPNNFPLFHRIVHRPQGCPERIEDRQ